MNYTSTTNAKKYFYKLPDTHATHNSESLINKPHLVNHGGKVLKDPKFVSLFYGDYWQSRRGKADSNYIESFGNFLFKSKHMEIWKEYGVQSATYLGNNIIKAKLDRVIDENEIKSIVEAQLRRGETPKADGETVYTVYLPPGSELRSADGYSSLSGMGGYHGSYLNAAGVPVYYAAVVYSKGSNGIQFSPSARDNLTVISSHEWAEAATDPNVGRGQLGWYDETYGEVADIPLSMGLPLNETWGRIGKYAVQKEWSNKDNRVELLPMKLSRINKLSID